MKNIHVFANGKLIGIVETLTQSEAHHKTDDGYNLIANRIRFDKLKVSEAFERGFVNRVAQFLPFQIEVTENDVPTAGAENAWITNNIVAFEASNHIIIDNCELECEKFWKKD